MSLDNTWISAQDRAKKAGRLLGEVLEKKVQGERPVVLVGTSLGALTVLTALQYLASLQTDGEVPAYVESAIMISLPAAPSPEEWVNVRRVVARRVVNAYSESDWVLAGVVR
jgi:alpha-beta hydrolase superfamily lysophospholipase